jgi:hypothetical protein
MKVSEQWDTMIYLVVRPRPTSMLWRPNGQGLQSTPLKWSRDQTWVPRLSSLLYVPVCVEFPQVGVSHTLQNMITIKNKSKGGSSNTHKDTNAARPRTHVRKDRTNENWQSLNSKYAQISLEWTKTWSESWGLLCDLVMFWCVARVSLHGTHGVLLYPQGS